MAPATASKDIVAIASSNPQFSTLVKAIKAAGLVNTLKGTGPFTVFAPTNAAFAKIPKAKLNAVLADKALLTKILTYHVLPGKVMAATVVGMSAPANQTTVEGSAVKVSPKPPMVNNAKIIKTDIAASNGVIHVIDTVLMPPMGGKMGAMKKM
ncbi:MAG: fasciclin domain-containing protein [Armatimonadota bacterium]